MRTDFNDGSSGLVGLVFVAILVIVSIMGFYILAAQFSQDHATAVSDPVNSTGILTSGAGWNATNLTVAMVGDIAPNLIYLLALAFVIVILLIVGTLSKIY